MEEIKKETQLKKGKKKNKVASLLLALALILTCGVAGTIAQYQKSFGGTSTATVAKFDVAAGDLNTAKTADLKLFDSVKDTADDATNGKEEDVAETAPSSGKLKIAPGTIGCTKVTLTNNSDVTVTLGLSGSITGDSVESGGKTYKLPLKFGISGDSTTKPTSWGTLDNALNLPSSDTTLAMNSGDTDKYLWWTWDYTGDNTVDTMLGEKADSLNPVVTLSVVFTQKN